MIEISDCIARLEEESFIVADSFVFDEVVDAISRISEVLKGFLQGERVDINAEEIEDWLDLNENISIAKLKNDNEHFIVAFKVRVGTSNVGVYRKFKIDALKFLVRW